MTTPTITLEGFCGPLDLLLHLIKEKEMSILDVSISEVADQYLALIDNMHTLNIEVAGNYIVMAAEMTRIKSRSLLPSLKETSQEEEIDPEEELRERLLEYQKVCEIARLLTEKEAIQGNVLLNAGRSHLKAELLQDDDAFCNLFEDEIQVIELTLTFQRLISEASEKNYQVLFEEFSVQDIMENLLEQLHKKGTECISFLRFIAPVTSKMEYAAHFLALLELISFQKIRIMQQEPLKEIFIYPRKR